jgi:hypothetical protein
MIWLRSNRRQQFALMALGAAFVAACSSGSVLKIGNSELIVPEGIVVQRSSEVDPGPFDRDYSVQLLLRGETEPVRKLRALLEPFDPFEGVAVELTDSQFYHPAQIGDLDMQMFAPANDPVIDNLRGFKSTNRFPLRRYFYPDGRRALSCSMQGEKNDVPVCTKENYFDGFVMQYRFLLRNHAQLPSIDRELADLLGIPLR